MEYIINIFTTISDLFWNLPTVWRLVIGVPIGLFLEYLVFWFPFSFIPGTIQYIRMKRTGCVLVKSWRGGRFYRNVSHSGWQIYDRSWWWHINHWWVFD